MGTETDFLVDLLDTCEILGETIIFTTVVSELTGLLVIRVKGKM